MERDNTTTLINLVSLVLAVGLPLLIVLPFGWLWLWQTGYLPFWLAATVVLSAGVFGWRFWWVRRVARLREQGTQSENARSEPMAEAYSLREQQAFRLVESLADQVDPKQIGSREDIIALGLGTIEIVARELHPEDKDPLFKFTVPEALTLVERVAQKLRPMVIDNIPLGDRLTVGQVIRVYGWRSYVDIANKAYDVWRVLRLMNPVAAATQEVRERMSKAAIQGLREDLAKRLAATYVREVGAAAIDLYGGRLRVTDEQVSDFVSEETARGREQHTAMAEPMRFLVVGQQGVGKSSLINALANDAQASVDVLPSAHGFQDYEVKREGMPDLVFTDSPGLVKVAEIEACVSRARSSDLIVLVLAAHRADRDLERKLLTSLRAAFSKMIDRRPPPIMLVATHIDRLRPLGTWQPPYDLSDENDPKSKSIRAAVDAVHNDLQVPTSDIVEVSVGQGLGAYNLEKVWAKLVDLLPDAKSVQVLRVLESVARDSKWRKVFSQIVGAGKLAARVIKKPDERS